MSDQTEGVFTIGEDAEYLKMSKSTLYKRAREGSILGQKVGRHRRFHRSLIDRWLGDIEQPTTSTPHKRHRQDART